MSAGLVGSYALATPKETRAHPAPPPETEDPVKGKETLSLRVNGKAVNVLVEPRMTLVELLRDKLQLTGTKVSCNHGECGACTVVINGKSVYSCQMLALDAAGKDVTTIEGLLDGEKLHPIQEAFLEHDGYQCGFCTSGQIMAAHALLYKHRRPTREQVLDGMAGNICRCAAYPNIIKSVLAAAEKAR
jgi:xanthine dehydrogenase YagT iron-sulfur-binding subunit